MVIFEVLRIKVTVLKRSACFGLEDPKIKPHERSGQVVEGLLFDHTKP